MTTCDFKYISEETVVISVFIKTFDRVEYNTYLSLVCSPES